MHLFPLLNGNIILAIHHLPVWSCERWFYEDLLHQMPFLIYLPTFLVWDQHYTTLFVHVSGKRDVWQTRGHLGAGVSTCSAMAHWYTLRFGITEIIMDQYMKVYFRLTHWLSRHHGQGHDLRFELAIDLGWILLTFLPTFGIKKGMYCVVTIGKIKTLFYFIWYNSLKIFC